MIDVSDKVVCPKCKVEYLHKVNTNSKGRTEYGLTWDSSDYVCPRCRHFFNVHTRIQEQSQW